MKKTENIVPKTKPIDWTKYIEPKKVVHVKVNSVLTVAHLEKINR